MRTIVILAGLAAAFCIAGLRMANGQDFNEINEVVCNLRYKTGGFDLDLHNLITTVSETNGPDFGRREVIRRVIKSVETDAKQMLFVWDKSESKLYLDLNNNLNINDANEVFTSSNKMTLHFENLHVERQFGDVRVLYVINASMYSSRYCDFSVLSGFEGSVELADKTWRVLFADNMDGIVGRGDYFAITSADGNFKVPKDTLDDYTPNELFLDGRNWIVSYEFATIDDQSCVRARFKQTPKETGKVKIEGKFIRYMTLKDGRLLTVIEHPEGEVEIPVGEYRFGQVFLDGGRMGLFEQDRYRQDRLIVEKDKTEILKVGGPLASSVEIKRTGRILQLSYKLKGIDGNKYTTEDRGDNKANPPEFEIYRGDKKIGYGIFSFG